MKAGTKIEGGFTGSRLFVADQAEWTPVQIDFPLSFVPGVNFGESQVGHDGDHLVNRLWTVRSRYVNINNGTDIGHVQRNKNTA